MIVTHKHTHQHISCNLKSQSIIFKATAIQNPGLKLVRNL
jgi:hypothetical protein